LLSVDAFLRNFTRLLSRIKYLLLKLHRWLYVKNGIIPICKLMNWMPLGRLNSDVYLLLHAPLHLSPFAKLKFVLVVLIIKFVFTSVTLKVSLSENNWILHYFLSHIFNKNVEFFFQHDTFVLTRHSNFLSTALHNLNKVGIKNYVILIFGQITRPTCVW
jgi:hypothetical protein